MKTFEEAYADWKKAVAERDNFTIPPEALEAAAIADFGADHNMLPWLAEQRWESMSVTAQARRIDRARAAAQALLNAWPQRKDEWRDNITFDGKPIRYSVIILPLKETDK